MEQLSGLDTLFLQQESDRTPTHISAILVYDISGVPRGYNPFKAVLATLENNLHKSPAFRRKLLNVPLNIGQPYWIDSQDFDLNAHVHRSTLPKPGNWEQLCRHMAELHGRGLDMSIPLWEAHVIEDLGSISGLPEKSFAVMIKVHHAAIDGVAALKVIHELHSLSPDAAEDHQPDDWQPEPAPSPWALVSRGYISNFKKPLQFFETAGSLLPAISKVTALMAEDPDQTDAKIVRTRFNGRVSDRRVVDGIRVKLNIIRQIKQAVPGGTVNDVLITIVGGALREYLEEKAELPKTSLFTAAPISVHDKVDLSVGSNHISTMIIPLATQIADPLKRLRKVHTEAEKSKDYANTLGAGSLINIAQSMTAQASLLGSRIASAAALNPAAPVPFNLVISNVPGPKKPLYLGQAKLHTLMGLGPLADNMGLFHLVFSNCDEFSIMFNSCADMLPDPEFYAACLQRSFDQLVAATCSQETG